MTPGSFDAHVVSGLVLWVSHNLGRVVTIIAIVGDVVTDRRGVGGSAWLKG